MARKKKPETPNTNEPTDKPELPPVKIEKFTKDLKVALTRDEVADRADRASQLLAEHDSKEEEQKAAAKHAKSVIESMAAEIRRLSNEVRTKSTYRDVMCERRYDYEKSILQEIRLDTGEVIFERPLTDAEKQRDLPFPPGGGIDDDFDDEAAAQ